MQAGTKGTILFPGFVLDLRRSELRDAAGARVALRPQAFALLRHLAVRADSLVGKDELMQAVWPGVVVTDDSLTQCVKDLRQALGDHEHRLIRTEPRRGYRLCREAADAGIDFKQEIRFATTDDGVRIAYATIGEGVPFVRAAHWTTHLDWDWRTDPFGPRLRHWSRTYKLVRYDGRGYGLSDRSVMPGTLDQSVGDLAAVVDAAGLERFALLGASGGAAIAIRYAARYPQRVARLVLMGAEVRGRLRQGLSPDNFDAMIRLVEDGWGQDNPAFRQLMTSLLWPGASAEQMQAFNHLQRVACSPAAAACLLRRTAEFDATDDLASVRCPALVLHSPRDAKVPFELGRLAASTIPRARLEPFDSPNHTPLSGEPAFDHVNRLIDEFINDAEAMAGWPGYGDATARPALRAVAASTDDPRRSKG